MPVTIKSIGNSGIVGCMLQVMQQVQYMYSFRIPAINNKTPAVTSAFGSLMTSVIFLQRFYLAKSTAYIDYFETPH